MARAPFPLRVPRDPGRGVLHRVLAAALPAYLEAYEADPGRTLPAFVRRELEGALACGSPDHGFGRYRCQACGLEEWIPFSCKGRGFCPSCGGRRMASQAAHLVDRVLPRVPIRQWVFTVPWELRTLLAFNPSVLEAVRRIWWDCVGWWYGMRAASQGVAGGRAGGVNIVQRFDSALRLNVHCHALVLSGVYDTSSDPVFHELPCPSADDLALILQRISFKVVDHLVAHGHLSPEGCAGAESSGALAFEVLAKAVAGGTALGGKVGLVGRDPFAPDRAVGSGVALLCPPPEVQAGHPFQEGHGGRGGGGEGGGRRRAGLLPLVLPAAPGIRYPGLGLSPLRWAAADGRLDHRSSGDRPDGGPPGEGIAVTGMDGRGDG